MKRFVFLSALLMTPAIALSMCLDMASSTLMYSNDCSSQPEIDRAFGGQVITWNEHNYLFAGIGNEIKVWLIDTATSPIVVTRSEFNVPNVGDSDYDLLNFSVCDGCRYGIANYKAGTILFDLGQGTMPNFNTFTYFGGANIVPGGLTFMHSNVQYLIASTLGESCATGDSGLARIWGTEASNLDWKDCVEASGVSSTQIVGGYRVGNYLYLGDRTTRVFIMEIIEDLGDISLNYIATPFIAYMIKDKGLAIDLESEIAILANANGMTVWDISDPGTPIERANVPGDFNRAAVRCQYAWVAKKGFKNSEQSFDISNRTNPQPLDSIFWDSENVWNLPDHQCAEVQGGVFSKDATSLYLSRYAVFQRVDFDGCGPCQVSDDVFSDNFETGTAQRWSAVEGGTITP